MMLLLSMQSAKYINSIHIYQSSRHQDIHPTIGVYTRQRSMDPTRVHVSYNHSLDSWTQQMEFTSIK